MCSLVQAPLRCDENTSFNWEGDCDSYLTSPLNLVTREEDLTFSRLVLSGEFEQLCPQGNERSPCNSIQLYLTDTKLIVASKNAPAPIKGSPARHVRTHLLCQILVEKDGKDMDVLRVISEGGEVFLYKSRKPAEIGLWLAKIFQSTSKRCSESPSSTDSTVTAEDRVHVSQSLPPAPSTPIFRIHRPSKEWHGETLLRYHSLPADEDSCNRHEKSSSLKRRGAFRIQDLKKFRPKGHSSRSSSVPPPDESLMSTSPVPPPSTPPVEPLSPMVSPRAFRDGPITSSAPSSMRKKKLNVKSFTRAFSARLTGANVIMPKSANTSPYFFKRGVKRGHSFHSSYSSSSTLPRLPSRGSKSERKSKGRSVTYSMITPEPVTPNKPKSPGTLLKLFHRKWNWSDVSTPTEEQVDGLAGDPQNKPNCRKLYLQNPKELAIELTLLDGEVFRSISMSELFNQAWTKKTKHTTSPNVLRMIDSFNRLARVVCTEIVHEKTVQGRSKAISNFIQLADQCYRLHNYNSMKAVISGLQSQAVYRLTRSWNHVSSRRKKKYEKLSNLLCDMDNVEHLKQDMYKNLQGNIHCVPYLGWLLTNILHSQTYSQIQNDVSYHRRSASLGATNQHKSWHESMYSISMPPSPVLTENETDSGDINSRNIKKKLFGSQEEISFLASIRNTLSKSLIDLPVSPPCKQSSPLKSETPHPLSNVAFFSGTPSVSMATDSTEFYTSSNHSSDTSNDEIQTDSAIGLDSSTAHTSPVRIIGNKRNGKEFFSKSMEIRNFGEYNLLPVDSNFESDDEDQNNSLSSSSTSLLSPSMITFSMIDKRRITLPNLINLPDPPNTKLSRSCSYYDFESGGILFSSCSLKSTESLDRGVVNTLEAVAQQLMESCDISRDSGSCERLHNDDGNDMKIVSETDFFILENNDKAKADSDRSHSMTITSTDNVYANNKIDVSIFNVFEQYQHNTLTYVSELTSQTWIRKLILESPWVDENECHTVSLKVEPNV